METGLAIAFGAGLGLVALSFVGVALGRLPDRVIALLAALLGATAAVAGVGLGLNFVWDYADTEPLLLGTGGIAAAALAEGGLLALARSLRRIREVERLGEEARGRLTALLEADVEARAAALERTLARERAEALHLLSEQERRLAEERRDALVRQAERAREELTDAVAAVQERLERRLTAWAADLDRGQRELEAQLAELAQRQQDALTAYGARLTADAEQLAAATEEQRAALARLRADLEQMATRLLGEARAEIELHTAERRRALHEVGEQLRMRERALREQVDREEDEARARLAAGLAEAERRQLKQLERALDRAAVRLAEEAERRFDAQIRRSREESAERLSRELDKAMEQFARRAENEVAKRIAEVAQATADRLQRRVEDIARSAEAQQEVSAHRVRMISERLDEALAGAEERIAALETQIELEVGAKLAELERMIRASEPE